MILDTKRFVLAATFAFGATAAHAQVTVYATDLAGFNTAAGTPSIAIDFDSIAPGTNIGGTAISGLTFTQIGSPLIVVRGGDMFTPMGVFSPVVDESTNKLYPTSGLNVLSPSGTRLDADPANETDSVTFTLAAPVSAFGFDFSGSPKIILPSILIFRSMTATIYCCTPGESRCPAAVTVIRAARISGESSQPPPISK